MSGPEEPRAPWIPEPGKYDWLEEVPVVPTGTPHVLHRVKVGSRVLISKEMMERTGQPWPSGVQGTELAVLADRDFDRLRWQLQAYVLADHRVDEQIEVEQRVAATWVDMLKMAHLVAWGRCPAWVRNRWPIRTRVLTQTVHLQQRLAFPHSTMWYPDELGKPVIWEQVAVWDR